MRCLRWKPPRSGVVSVLVADVRYARLFKRIKPAALSRQILALTGQLEILALAKKPAPVKPAVNSALLR